MQATAVAGSSLGSVEKEAERMTYHRPLEVVGALLEFPQGLLLVVCPLDHARDARRSDILKDGLQLVGRGRVLGDVQLKLLALGGLCLRCVIGRLVLGSSLGGGGRGLLQEVGNTDRGRGGGLVEEGDDVERFVLLV